MTTPVETEAGGGRPAAAAAGPGWFGRHRPTRRADRDGRGQQRSAPVLPFWLAVVVAAVSGGLLVAAFPPIGWWPLAVPAVAGLSVAVHGRSARAGAVVGLVFGLAFFCPLLHWTATYVGSTPWLILAVFEALYVAVMAGFAAVVQRLPGWPVVVAALWVAQEALRDRVPFGGFPWGRLAFSQPEGPFLPFAAVGGAPVMTFLVALSGASLGLAIVTARRRGSRRLLAGAVAGVVVVPMSGLLAGLAVSSGRAAPKTTVAMIQGNVPRLGLTFSAQRYAVLDNHLRATFALAAAVKAGAKPRPSMVLWPENASDVDPLTDPAAAAAITRAARAVGAPILVGAILAGPGSNHRRNAGIVWSPVSGPGATYVKRHPVPFGEYIPMRGLARMVTKDVDLVPQDMVAGHAVGALPIGGTTIGDVICFEVAYDGLVRDDVDHGARLLVVQTNNATFGHSGESPQQLAMSRIRAVEHDRSTLVVSTSGISAVIAPDGAVQARSGIFTRATFDRPVPLESRRTLADWVGVWPEWVLTALGVGCVLASVLVRQPGEESGVQAG